MVLRNRKIAECTLKESVCGLLVPQREQKVCETVGEKGLNNGSCTHRRETQGFLRLIYPERKLRSLHRKKKKGHLSA